MGKKREYRGCEWESPIYRQIVAEKKAKQGLHSTTDTSINEYKTKRGKRSKYNFIIVILLGLFSFNSQAQIVSYVKYKHEADLIVYEVDYKWQADICYTICANRYEAKDGIWCISDRKEGIRLYRAKYRHEADILVFRVKYKHEIKGRIDN